MSTKTYKNKRDFTKTPEPEMGSRKKLKHPIYVIQKHDASQLHYDFRLEIGDSLISWVLPNGPSTDPSKKVLAIRTEAHPIDYADFEGVIPEGEYGAGTVIIWDRGTFQNKTTGDHDKKVDLTKAVENGHFKINISGEKLNGGYAMTRFDKKAEDQQWLLVKMDDAEADARRNPTNTEPKSVKSGKTIEEVRAEAKS